jgi:hypothetical protein
MDVDTRLTNAVFSIPPGSCTSAGVMTSNTIFEVPQEEKKGSMRIATTRISNVLCFIGIHLTDRKYGVLKIQIYLGRIDLMNANAKANAFKWNVLKYTPHSYGDTTFALSRDFSIPQAEENSGQD